MQLSDIVPWGRSYEEYVAMFSLTESDLQRRILGCGDGPASFHAECMTQGGNVVSVDPLYRFEGAAIANRFEEAAPTIISQVSNTLSSWVWTHHGTPAGLLACRRRALNHFLADYDRGRVMGRYLAEALPSLSFEDKIFDLALCSHFLFLYSTHLSEEFHVQSLLELCRVSHEVRIFPLLTLEGEPSPHLAAVLKAATTHSLQMEIVKVSYEFQRGGNEMLVVRGSERKEALPSGHPHCSSSFS
jgi:hypothetical protein